MERPIRESLLPFRQLLHHVRHSDTAASETPSCTAAHFCVLPIKRVSMGSKSIVTPVSDSQLEEDSHHHSHAQPGQFHCVTIVLFTLPCSQTQSDATRIPSARLDRLLVSLARAHTTCTYVCNTSMVTSVTTTVTSPQSSAQHGHDRCHHLLAACVKLHGAGGNTLSKRLFPPPCTHSC